MGTTFLPEIIMTTLTPYCFILSQEMDLLCSEKPIDLWLISTCDTAQDMQKQLPLQGGYSTPPSCYAIEASFDICEDRMISEIYAKRI